ncbi:LysR family transcriptional regulator [Corynebacterium lizhenjunii]|uniref:LysR family transcriptional regulator n=1 Tax=Corynebacterium lizhenjunii TaxID=2709394 RepID=A0A7T0KFL4_9CORY|nr:LysR family transcriptional regulator [Corynebacterium lizhenjunii]QPK79883.1 LysR family transcriptional regulator [Corynebacterium lizhenjunii]
MLEVIFATGTQPDKWFQRYADYTNHGGVDPCPADDAVAALRPGAVALARLPREGDPRVGEDYHVVELYAEEPGIAVPKDSIFAEVGEPVHSDDVAEEICNYRTPADGRVDVAAVRAGLQVVGANVGVVYAPRPLLKVLAKKQVVDLGLRDWQGPHTVVSLVWRKVDDKEAIQDFVGICKGRTPNSSRTSATKKTAREKTRAKQERRLQASGRKPLSKRKKGTSQGKRR